MTCGKMKSQYLPGVLFVGDWADLASPMQFQIQANNHCVCLQHLFRIRNYESSRPVVFPVLLANSGQQRRKRPLQVSSIDTRDDRESFCECLLFPPVFSSFRGEGMCQICTEAICHHLLGGEFQYVTYARIFDLSSTHGMYQ